MVSNKGGNGERRVKTERGHMGRRYWGGRVWGIWVNREKGIWEEKSNHKRGLFVHIGLWRVRAAPSPRISFSSLFFIG